VSTDATLQARANPSRPAFLKAAAAARVRLLRCALFPFRLVIEIHDLPRPSRVAEDTDGDPCPTVAVLVAEQLDVRGRGVKGAEFALLACLLEDRSKPYLVAVSASSAELLRCAARPDTVTNELRDFDGSQQPLSLRCLSRRRRVVRIRTGRRARRASPRIGAEAAAAVQPRRTRRGLNLRPPALTWTPSTSRG
jgi:hypothetical protein